MTTQEAIKILEQDCPKRPQKLWSVKRKEAVKMAIKALSCSEEPNRSDCISRQAAIDALAKFVPYVIDDVSTESYTNGLTDAYNLICQLPSAQPERKKAKWEKDELYGEDAYVCTHCETIWNTGQIKNMNYCPTCGSEMRGGNND